MEHAQEVKEYIIKFYPEWDINTHLSNGDNVEICENGNVVYNSIVTIKTQITNNQ